MSIREPIKLLQFRAAYNLPVHAAMEAGIFASHGLAVEAVYTPGSFYLNQALRAGRCDIGHTGADDIIADIENDSSSDIFIFMGLHSGLFSLVGAADCPSVEALLRRTIGVDAKSSGFALVVQRMLHANGIAKDNYELIEVGGWERRYAALLEGKITATLLTEPFIGNALRAGCKLLARDFEMIPSYQGTCGAASRTWAGRHPELVIRYIRAYMESTRYCFDSQNRASCLEILARHNEIRGRAAEHTLDALLDARHGLYPKAAVNLSGVTAALDLRAELGYLARPFSPLEKYIDLSYYQAALSVGDQTPREIRRQ
ncbi:MAG: ABC transporter substrate-binding protein [Candidatus Binatia bacterium]